MQCFGIIIYINGFYSLLNLLMLNNYFKNNKKTKECSMAYSIAPGGLFPSFDTLRHGVPFMGVKDFISATLVCKTWNQIMNDNKLWFSLAKRFPSVEGIKKNFKPVVLKLSRIEIICPTVGKS